MKSDYSSIANYYDRYRSFAPSTLRFWLSHLVGLGGVHANDSVLDLGCGTGRFSIPLAHGMGARVYAIDQSSAMLDQAAGKPGSALVHWVLGDAHTVPFASHSFSMVFMSLVIHHVEDRQRALASILDTLRPGGRLVIWTSSHRQIRRFFLGRYFPSLIPVDLQRFPPVGVLMAEMRRVGFADVRRRAVVKQETVSKADLLDKVRNRYISTLSLIPEGEFAAGVRLLQANLAAQPSDRYQRAYRYTFVTGQRPL